jgi:hypothetical protein
MLNYATIFATMFVVIATKRDVSALPSAEDPAGKASNGRG